MELQYPKSKIKLIKNSGLYQDSFDVEMRHGKKLFILDFCTLILKEHEDKVYFYLNLNHKNSQRYEDIEKKRNANTYFAFRYNNEYLVVLASKIWDLTDKSTIPLSKVLHISQTFYSFG